MCMFVCIFRCMYICMNVYKCACVIRFKFLLWSCPGRLIPSVMLFLRAPSRGANPSLGTTALQYTSSPTAMQTYYLDTEQCL